MSISASKLFQVLKKLDNKQRTRLQTYLQSSYFNQRQDVIQLFQALLHLDKPLDDKQLFEIIYPKKSYKPTELRLVMSYLFKLVEAFCCKHTGKKSK
ncbi:MAG: hypothetical protein HC892_18595 [Saprospiraceae bacterium]|nr:hypothetical protein [Saprospiraceae bacterium]